jgi:hypothetical protein
MQDNKTQDPLSKLQDQLFKLQVQFSKIPSINGENWLGESCVM